MVVRNDTSTFIDFNKSKAKSSISEEEKYNEPIQGIKESNIFGNQGLESDKEKYKKKNGIEERKKKKKTHRKKPHLKLKVRVSVLCP